MHICDDDNDVDDGYDDDEVDDTKLFRKLLFVTGAHRKTLPVANPQISRWEG